MTDPRVGPQDVEEYLDVALKGNGSRGVRFTLDLLDRGRSYEDVIVNLLAAAQHESGQRWVQSLWSVADEHLVSGVTQKALDALASTVDEEPTMGPPVVVTCAEGDWHSLAGQMVAEQLRGRGVETVFLGASTPAAQVNDFLARRGAAGLAISCSLPLFFGGVVSLANAAHAHGIPVLAGGRGLGTSARRSCRLGVDAWADGIDKSVDVLRSWRREAPAVSEPGISLDPIAVQLDARAAELGWAAFAALELSMPQIFEYDEAQRARTMEDLAYIVRFTAAARAVDDASVLTEFVAWLVDVLRHRGVSSKAVVSGLLAVEPGVSQLDPMAGRWLLDEAQAAARIGAS